MLGGGAPGINAVIRVDFSSDDIVIVLANLDPPAAEVLLQEIKHIIAAIVR